MISNGSIQMEFGTGDISIGVGGLKGCGMLLFEQQKPKEIGTPEIWDSVKMVSSEEFPVSMTFSCEESIDAFIQALLMAKRIMKGDVTLRLPS